MQSPTPGAIRASIPASLDGGIALAIGAALISGLAVYLNAFAVKQLPDAAVYTTLKNGVAAAILIAITLALGGYREARVIPRRQWGPILAVGVIGGSVPFILFFSGLAQASAPTAAFIQKTLFIWVAFLAVPFLGEKLGVATLAGLGGLLLGQALILPPAGIVWGSGETMILVATLLWAAETIVVRRLLGSVSSHLMGALRMGVGLVGLIGYLAVTGKLAGVGLLTSTQWAWALMTGVILAGYVTTWFAALSRAPATVVTSVLVLGAVVTGALTAATRGTAPSPNVVAGYVLIVAAATLVVVWARAAARRVATASGRPDLAPLDSV
jgi:drug/metabolite transporter (DMT)-like permease